MVLSMNDGSSSNYAEDESWDLMVLILRPPVCNQSMYKLVRTYMIIKKIKKIY